MAEITVLFLILMVLGNASAYSPSRDDWLAAITTNGGSCVAAGHRGCCRGSISACTVRTRGQPSCRCDRLCSRACCSDIYRAGCFPYPTCEYARLQPGCCRSPSTLCRVWRNFRHCYCDTACKKFNDCCPDVPRTLRCNEEDEELKQLDLASIIQQRPMLQREISEKMLDAAELMPRRVLKDDGLDDDTQFLSQRPAFAEYQMNEDQMEELIKKQLLDTHLGDERKSSTTGDEEQKGSKIIN